MRKWKRGNLNIAKVIRTNKVKIIREPDFDFLKNFRIVRFWVKDNYNLSLNELEMLMFLYGEGIFDYRQFLNFDALNKWDNKRFRQMREDLWIVPYGKGNNGKTVYELSNKSRAICTRVYKILYGLEVLPVDPKKNKSIGLERYAERQRFKETQRLHHSTFERKITFRDPTEGWNREEDIVFIEPDTEYFVSDPDEEQS